MGSKSHAVRFPCFSAQFLRACFRSAVWVVACYFAANSALSAIGQEMGAAVELHSAKTLLRKLETQGELAPSERRELVELLHLGNSTIGRPGTLDSQTFVIGVVTGSLLLIMGLVIGLLVGKKTAPVVTNPPSSERVEKLFSELFQFTNGFAGDVSECRQFVERVRLIADQAGAKRVGGETRDTNQLLSQLVRDNQHLQARLDVAETSLKSQSESLAAYLSEARTDGLTRLPNRRAFDDEITRRFAEWRRHGKSLSVLMVDIDHFKSFNDRFGHQAGDAILAGVAQTLRETVRQTDLLARYGGEEFAVVISSASTQEAIQAADRARNAVEKAVYQYEGKPIHVSISCGVAQCQDGESASQLTKRADVALYASKNAGRNAAHWHDGKNCRRIGEPNSNKTSEKNDAASEFSTGRANPSNEFVKSRSAIRKKLTELLDE